MLNRHRIPDLRDEIELGTYGILPEDREIIIRLEEKMYPKWEQRVLDNSLDSRCTLAFHNWVETLNH
jgi:hypothetical protein